MNNNGVFFIMNAFPREGTSWYDFVKFKNRDEYVDLLKRRGFHDVRADVFKNTIIVYGWRRAGNSG